MTLEPTRTTLYWHPEVKRILNMPDGDEETFAIKEVRGYVRVALEGIRRWVPPKPVRGQSLAYDGPPMLEVPVLLNWTWANLLFESPLDIWALMSVLGVYCYYNSLSERRVRGVKSG